MEHRDGFNGTARTWSQTEFVPVNFDKARCASSSDNIDHDRRSGNPTTVSNRCGVYAAMKLHHDIAPLRDIVSAQLADVTLKSTEGSAALRIWTKTCNASKSKVRGIVLARRSAEEPFLSDCFLSRNIIERFRIIINSITSSVGIIITTIIISIIIMIITIISINYHYEVLKGRMTFVAPG